MLFSNFQRYPQPFTIVMLFHDIIFMLVKSCYITAPVVMCSAPSIDWRNAQKPSTNYSGVQPVGTTIMHLCSAGYAFASTKQPFRLYTCLANGSWAELTGERCEREILCL